MKRDRGGSGAGIGPVQTKGTDTNQGRVSFLHVNEANCSTVGTPGVDGAPVIGHPDYTGSVASPRWVPLRECAATYIQQRYTEMGTSDIEPDKFFGINEPLVDGVGLPFRTEIDRAFVGKSTLAAVALNTPVTLALRNVLQTEQFPAANVCNPAHPSYNLLTADPTDRPDTTNAESEPCMPSLKQLMKLRSRRSTVPSIHEMKWNIKRKRSRHFTGKPHPLALF